MRTRTRTATPRLSPEDLEDRDTTPQPVGGAEDDGLDDDEEEEKPKAQGTTLFVRNISFEATEAELYDLYVPLLRAF
jgi:nucleolar protein 4